MGESRAAYLRAATDGEPMDVALLTATMTVAVRVRHERAFARGNVARLGNRDASGTAGCRRPNPGRPGARQRLARKGSSSSWRSRSAEGSGRRPTASSVSVVVPGQDPIPDSAGLSAGRHGHSGTPGQLARRSPRWTVHVQLDLAVRGGVGPEQ